MARDSIALQPSAVEVGFPAVSGAKVPCACYPHSHWVVRVTPEDVGLDPSIPDTDPHAVVFVRSAAIAVFVEGEPVEADPEADPPVEASDGCPEEPANADALRLIAERVALDVYAHRAAPHRDMTFPGTLAWELEGTTDLVITSYRPDECRTRVRSAPHGHEPEELWQATAEDFGGAGYLTEWAWLMTPSGGIPGGMGSALCDVWEEPDGEDPAAPEAVDAGVRVDRVWNPWTGDVGGNVLIRAVVRERPGRRNYLAITEEDCPPEAP